MASGSDIERRDGMATELGKSEIKRLAQLGALARLEQLEVERRAILRAFPGLSVPVGRPAEAAKGEVETAKAPVKKRGRKRRKMSAAERKAISERMKKFWAARKQQA
jgi:hypothetical protein